MLILGIDPGTRESAFVLWDDSREIIMDKGIEENSVFANRLFEREYGRMVQGKAIEMIDNNGQAVGNDTFETVLWIGVFLFALRVDLTDMHKHLIYRRWVKMNLCHTMKGIKDANVRQALINRFGEPGRKACPGKLYGVRSHEWSALAVAVTYSDRLKEQSYNQPS